MKIINITKNTFLAEDATLADTPFKRFIGLLSRKDFLSRQALVLRPCNSIHTLFMRFPIDVLFLDKNSRVIAAVSDLKPFRFTPIYFLARAAIELPAGTIASSRTQLGDTISII